MTGPAGFLADLFSLTGRVAVVTGGSSGIGAGMAAALARAGAQVVLVARDAERLGSAAGGLRACGGQAAWVSADLADRAGLERAADEAAAAFGPPDILLNCAGINLRPALASLTAADWDLTMAVNLTAPFLLGQRFGPSMAARGWGRIINVTSQQAQRAFGNSGGYGASKGGLAALTRSQSEAWARSGVCCNSVCPGFVATRLNAAVAADPERMAAMAARTMTGRNGEPADFAGVAVFLASRASDYVTGQTLYVDGGFSHQIRGITQIPVNEKKGLTFARGLRSILRHDPDKILVGEIRDNETAQIAINSALTGHLVFTTVHANNVVDVLGRFVNMGVEVYNFVSALNCILAQRLVRTICEYCARPVSYDDETLKASGMDPADWRGFEFREGLGCIECGGTGYRGRTAIHELLDLTDPIRELILAKKPTSEVRKLAQKEGMSFLRESALDRVRRGLTTLKEINKVTFIEASR
ncbi:MAG: SDR family oxidoreductase [Terracidiphilus sp.]